MTQRTASQARLRARQRAAAGQDAAPRSPAGGGGFPRGEGEVEPLAVARTTRPSLRSRLRYRFDLTVSRGSGALIGWLMLVTAAFVLLTGLLLFIAAQTDHMSGSVSESPWEAAWQSLMHTIDPGTVTGAEEKWTFRWAALFITVVGIFIFSTLIGLIASVIDRTVENLRKGRGIVAEEGHTLILGWSEKLHTIISELQVANANQRHSSIVVLADRDRIEMEDEINARFRGNLALDLLTGRSVLGVARFLTRTSRGNTRVVCRTGDPADPADLALVSPTAARSVIVLSDDRPMADAHAAKVLLSLMSFDPQLTGLNVTVELQDQDSAEALVEAADGRIHTVVSSDLVAQVTAQICRQSGMGAVFQELLDFDGSEVYFTHEPRLVGHSFGQAMLSYEHSSVIGIRRADGKIELNPPKNSRIGAEDHIIAISEDDDTLIMGALDEWADASVPRASTNGAVSDTLPPDHLLMVGWNANGAQVLEHLARATSPGSTLDLVVDPAVTTVDRGELPNGEGNLAVRVIEADGSRADTLRPLLAEREYERLVLLGYRDVLTASEADARTLLTLVQARRALAGDARNAGASIIAEILDVRSVRLGRIANPDDFVVSERLTSLLLAQLAENAELAHVFAELLDGTGGEIVMRPLAPYLHDPAEADDDPRPTVSWREIVRVGRERDESPIGYALPPVHSGRNGGVHINPAKSAQLPTEQDVHVIVLCGRSD